MRHLMVMENFESDLTDGNYIIDGLWSDDTGYIILKVAFYRAKWSTSGSTGCYYSKSLLD